MKPFSISVILCLIAIIIFALATFGVSFSAVNLVALGLAFFAASFIVS